MRAKRTKAPTAYDDAQTTEEETAKALEKLNTAVDVTQEAVYALRRAAARAVIGVSFSAITEALKQAEHVAEATRTTANATVRAVQRAQVAVREKEKERRFTTEAPT